jgi:hypothetical protein
MASLMAPSPPFLTSRSTADRLDDITGPQVHIVYALPQDGVDAQLDLNGGISASLGVAQAWLRNQNGGSGFRFDTFGGELDVTFFRDSRTDATLKSFGAFVRDQLESDMRAAGLLTPGKLYLVYYGGGSTFACGGAAWPPALAGQISALYLKGTPPGSIPCDSTPLATQGHAAGYWEFSALHEVMHTLGFVPACAPHHALSGHTGDDPRDLMYAGPLPWQPSILDVNGDDYLRPAAPGCASIADNAYFESPSTATFAVDRAALTFGAVRSGTAFAANTTAQTVRLIQSGGSGPVAWAATSDQPWLTVSPASGSGSAPLSLSVKFAQGLPASGTVSGKISLSFTGATTTAGPITVGLIVLATSGNPFGGLETPVTNSTRLNGSIAVTGWVLDDIETTEVQLWRDPHPLDPPGAVAGGNTIQTGKVYIGQASFVDGARPDLEAAFPGLPLKSRAGWGYLMLTRGLVWDGKGSFKLYAFAADRDGHFVPLGTTTIGIDNASATAPFGSIDTPGQGATASGLYPNTGWVLTPNAGATIPADKVQVAIDGVFLPGTFSMSTRADISDGFPQFNTAGSGRGLFIDTTKFADGTHTIGWLVTDSLGKADGVGSRFFTVANATSALRAAEPMPEARAMEHVSLDATAIRARRGWDADADLAWIEPDRYGRLAIESEELGRVELRLDEAATGPWRGYLRVAGTLRALPAGSHLTSDGTFTWQPAAGFVGAYDLVFMRIDDRGEGRVRREVRISLGAMRGSGRRDK